MPRENVKVFFVVLLLTLAVSLTGCSTVSTVPASQTCPAVPPMPSPSESQPSKPYSASVQDSLRTWEKLLTDTPLTP